ncbi:MAG TPA: DUF2975 domain-containing protein [Acidimicrobiales bacterium]
MTLTLGALWVATLALLPLGYLYLTERGSPTLHVTIDPDYTVDLPDGRQIVVGDDVATLVNFAAGDEYRYLTHDSPPTLHTSMKIDREDTDTRILLVAWLATILGLAWFGWVNLQRVVRAARDDRPFDPRNPVRLRCLAGLVLASPVIAWAMSRTLDALFDGNPAAHVDLDGPGWWFSLTVGLGLLALAQVFGEGARLRELEETTV